MQFQHTLLGKTLSSAFPYGHKGKVTFKSYNQDQEFLLPKRLDDFIEQGHIARLISKVIDGMDLSAIFSTYKGGGTSAYHPRMLLKSWILGFVNRIYSSRQLAKQLRENLGFIWISGDQRPDFRTLSNFRLRLKDDIKKIFKEIVLYAVAQGIIQAKDVFVDHSKFTANANKHKVVWKKRVNTQLSKIDVELEELFSYIDQIDEEEDKIFAGKDLPEQERDGFDPEQIRKIIDQINDRVKSKEVTREQGRDDRKKVRRVRELHKRKEKYEQQKKILAGRNSYSSTDHDAVAMMMKDKLTIRPAYNEGIAVENGIVLDFIISDCSGDSVSFIPLMNGAIDNLGKTPENVCADAAYGNEEDALFLEKRGMNDFLKYNTYHKEKSKKWREERFRLVDFSYDKQADEFTCKNHIRLTFEKEEQRKTRTGFTQTLKTYRAQEGHCLQCPFRKKCTTAQTRTLRVNWQAERLKQRAKQNLDSPKGKELRKRRGHEVESVFGDQKLNKTKRRYILRGLEKVKIESGLYYIAHNLRKIKTMTAKLRARGSLPATKERNSLLQMSESGGFVVFLRRAFFQGFTF